MEKKRPKRIDFVIEQYGKMKNDVERAIRISINLKIHKPESISEEEFRALANDPEFKRRIEELVVSYIREKRGAEG